jgi:hypothetical protein
VELIEFIPGGLAAAWMAFRMIALFRNGPVQENAETSL